MCDISNTHICLESVTDDCDVFTDVCSIHVLDHGRGCFLPKPRLLFCALLCKYTMQIVTCHIPSIYMHVGLSVFSPCCKIFMWEYFRGLFLFSQAYAGSDVGVLSFGSPINASALFIILLHQVIESNTLVRLTTTTQNHLYFSWAVSQLLCLYNNKCVA